MGADHGREEPPGQNVVTKAPKKGCSKDPERVRLSQRKQRGKIQGFQMIKKPKNARTHARHLEKTNRGKLLDRGTKKGSLRISRAQGDASAGK